MDKKQQTFPVAMPADFAAVVEWVLSEDMRGASGAAHVLTLSGDLGAGKTTFTQQLAAHLGVTEPVTSPTFGIMDHYELDGTFGFDQLIHIDAYRIEDSSEAGPLRLTELFEQPRTIICIEWPEQIAAILPAERLAITLSLADEPGDETRTVSVEKIGE